MVRVCDAARLALGRMRNSNTFNAVIPAQAGLHSFNAVIPAKAGIHWPLKVKMDPRAVIKMSGDDASVANRCDATRLALGRLRQFTTFNAVIPAKAGIHCVLVQHGSPLSRG